MELQPCIEETRAFGVAHCGLKALTAKKQLRARPGSLLLTTRSLRGWGDRVDETCGAALRETDHKRLSATAGRTRHCCSERSGMQRTKSWLSRTVDLDFLEANQRPGECGPAP